MKKALIIIDIQNDYFENWIFPQYKPELLLAPISQTIEYAKDNGWLIIFIKHESPQGFLVKDTHGSWIHADLEWYLKDWVTIIKNHADSFIDTDLENILQENNVKSLIITGIMTQNCVTHTAISESAKKYDVTVLRNAVTAPSEMINNIALKALSDRVSVVNNLADYLS